MRPSSRTTVRPPLALPRGDGRDSVALVTRLDAPGFSPTSVSDAEEVTSAVRHATPVRVVGRYALFEEIAHGGMGVVHFGQLRGAAGFRRIVAVKCLFPPYAKDEHFVAMFKDEARLAARVVHPHVVPILDVVRAAGELFLVMEYVEGEPLSSLLRSDPDTPHPMPLSVAAGIVAGALRGLHAAHEAKSERGEKLGLVHRDVSPQNVLVGVDGIARVADFGIAKARGRLQTTENGAVKGKFGYMSPEQMHGEAIDRRADIFAAGVVLWECLTGERLFRGTAEEGGFAQVLSKTISAPSTVRSHIPEELDDIVLRATARSRVYRYETAEEMAEALECALPNASLAEIGGWVRRKARVPLERRAHTVQWIEKGQDPLELVSSEPQLRRAIDDAAVEAEPVIPGPVQRPSPLPRPSKASPWVLLPSAALVCVAAWIVGSRVSFLASPPANGERSAPETPREGTRSSALRTELAVPLALPTLSSGESVPDIAGSSATMPAPTLVRLDPTSSPLGRRTQTSVPDKPPTPKGRAFAPASPLVAHCTPPFTIDASGLKHYKTECLR